MYLTAAQLDAYAERKKTWTTPDDGGYAETDAYRFTLDAILRHRLPRRPKILDLAGGDGDFLSYTYLTLNASEINLVDSSQKMLDRAREIEGISSTYKQNLDDFEIPHKVDLITCLFALYHAEDPQSVINRIGSALNPGGLFVATTIRWGSLTRTVDKLGASDGYSPYHDRYQVGDYSYDAYDIVERGTWDTRVDFKTPDNLRRFLESTLTMKDLAERVTDSTPLVDMGRYEYIVARKK